MTARHARSIAGLLSRRSMLTGAAAGVVAPVAASALRGAATLAAADHVRDHAGHGDEDEVHRLTLYAEELPGGLVGYGLEPGKATIPGPVLEVYEGDTLEIELVNSTSSRLSIHPHGVLYGVEADGSPMNDSFNEPGETRTYVWRTRRPRRGPRGLWLPGNAGYWHYHDHAMGGEHGTEGISKGLYGALIVRRRGDVLPDRQFTIAFNGTTINNRLAPDVPVLECDLGERVEIIAIGHGNGSHTFHLHAHRWADTRTGYLEGPDDRSPAVDNRELNPGDSFGFQVVAGDGVGPGAWMYHCHVQAHADDGMVGVLLVRDADGTVPDSVQAALDHYHLHVGTAQ